MIEKKVAWESFDMKGATVDEVEDDDFDEDDDDESEVSINMVGKFQNTPMGIVPDIKRTVFKAYPLWTGHTNFRLTMLEYSIISDVPGVESLVPVSPYRFVVGFGKMFESAQVKTEISRKITKVLSSAVLDMKAAAETHNSELDEGYNHLFAEFVQKTKEYCYVAMYIIPNGEVDWACTNNSEEFEDKVNDYFKAYQLIGGYLKIE